MSDYTLPPLPAPFGALERDGLWNGLPREGHDDVYDAEQMTAYAEAARAPLLAANAALSARIAELEGQLTLAQADGPDAKRYRWLKERKGLVLRSEKQPNIWIREDGSEFCVTHSLAAEGTQYGAWQSLDETIDAAMKENGDA